MRYLADETSRARRADPRLILPECQSILVLGTPYHPPSRLSASASRIQGRIAAYAWGRDYHLVLPERMKQLVAFIESQVGHPIPNRWYTDTGPILERDLAQRAGLGWIGKNTCLIHPRFGSTFFLSEILLGLELDPDLPFTADQCGTCTRCLDACPTQCIQPDRTLDARRCISYLTIENKGEIPEDLRVQMGNWVFGCDACQQACPWNRFAPEADAAFEKLVQLRTLTEDLALTPKAFNRAFKDSPIQRTKRRGYLRNVSVALGNLGEESTLPALELALEDPEPLVREHAAWAIQTIQENA